MKVYVSAIDRESCKSDETGYVFLLNWEKGKITIQNKITTQDASLQEKFWNPRGGNRGARGIDFYKNKLYVATATSVKVYNKNLKLEGEITNPYFAGLHTLRVGEDGVLVASTAHDMLMKVGFDGKEKFIWRGSESCYLQNVLNFKGRPEIRETKDIDEQYLVANRLHLSGLAVCGDYTYVLSGKYGAVIKLNLGTPNTNLPEQLLINTGLQGSHDICITSDKTKMFMNNTIRQQLACFSLAGDPLYTIDTKVYQTERVSMFSTPGWQRGLARLTDSIYIVGTSPLTIFTVDIERKKIVDKFQISDKLTLASYGIVPVFG